MKETGNGWMVEEGEGVGEGGGVGIVDGGSNHPSICSKSWIL